MNIKKMGLLTAVVIVLFGILMLLPKSGPTTNKKDYIPPPARPEDGVYAVDDELVMLKDGKASTPAAPGSAETIDTAMFGVPTYGDLDGDGKQDAAFWLVQTSGGTGTFYYLAVAMNIGTGYQGSNAIFVGDRIAPQVVEIKNGQAIANYADRAPGEPFSAQPSMGKSLYAKMQNGVLVNVTGQKAN